MIVDRAIVKGLVETVTDGLVNFGVKTRYFTSFDVLARSYISFPEITLNGDFSLAIDVEYKPKGAFSCLMSGSNFRVSVRGTNSGSAGSLFVDGAGFGNDATQNSGPVFEAGKLSRLTVTRAGSLWNFNINGQDVITVTRSTGSIFLEALGRNLSSIGGADPVEGITANFSVEDSVQALINMPIDGNYTPTNSTVLDVSGNDNHGTFVSVATGDSKLFTQRSDGNYYGNNVAPIGEFNKTDSGPLLVPLDNQLEPNEIYDVEFNYDNNTSSPAVRLGSATSGGLLGNLSSNVTNTVFSGQAAAASNNGLYVIGTASLCTLRDIRIERFLEVAY